MNNISSSSQITIQRECSLDEWILYVSNHHGSTIYHLPQWKKVLEESFHYSPFYLFARDRDGKLCGILPLFQIKSLITGNRLVSLPFSYICGPIADSEEMLIALINEAKKLCHALKCNYIEIRMMGNNDGTAMTIPWHELGFGISKHFSTSVLYLSSTDILWKRLDARRRWGIRRAKRDEVIIRESNCIKDLGVFYELNLKTKKRLGVPAHPFEFLKGIYTNMGEFTRLYLAEFQGKPIAGIVNLEFKDTIVYSYGASNRDHRKHRPNDLLLWTAIAEGCRRTFRYFDFGKTAESEEGLSSFKKGLGGVERELWYCYYPRIPDSMALNNEGLKYRMATGLWKRMPLALARWGSDRVFKHFD